MFDNDNQFDFLDPKIIALGLLIILGIGFLGGIVFSQILFPQKSVDLSVDLSNIERDINVLLSNQAEIYSINFFAGCVQVREVNGQNKIFPLSMSVSDEAELPLNNGIVQKVKVFNGIVCAQGGGGGDTT